MVFNEEFVYKMISTVGFPIFIACYHIFFQERTLRKMSAAIEKMAEALYHQERPTPIAEYTA